MKIKDNLRELGKLMLLPILPCRIRERRHGNGFRVRQTYASNVREKNKGTATQVMHVGTNNWPFTP